MKRTCINACRIVIGLLFCAVNFFGQNKPARLDTVFCDCASARVVKISGSTKIGPTIPPPGAGAANEITSSHFHTPYVFEKEHHSAWYKLIFNVSGNLSFDILPTNPLDDYDFVLFKAGNNNFCDSLQKHRIKPLRSNISRDKNEIQGKTGLALRAKRELVKEGVNDAYSQSAKVEKGEVYYLVVDNVYENGDGHTILFFFEQKVEIKGVVKDDEDRPLITTVSVTDIKGEAVAETVTDKRTGAYNLPAILRKNVTYSLNYFSDSAFVFSKTFSVKDTAGLKNIQVVLPRLKKGKKYTLGAINFYGNSPEYLPSARPSVENLYKLMSKNKTLEILIEGHVNCAVASKKYKFVESPFETQLSIDRAEAIKNFLVKKGIKNERIGTQGKGCSEMLFPVTTSEREMEQNRRVEIKVVEF